MDAGHVALVIDADYNYIHYTFRQRARWLCELIHYKIMCGEFIDCDLFQFLSSAFYTCLLGYYYLFAFNFNIFMIMIYWSLTSDKNVDVCQMIKGDLEILLHVPHIAHGH